MPLDEVAWARVHHRAMNDASSQRKLIEEKVTEVVRYRGRQNECGRASVC